MQDELDQVQPRPFRIAESYLAYREDRVQLTDDDFTGYTHLLTSRQGLYAIRPDGFKRLAHGFFFGITLRDDAIWVFEACDQPRGPTRQGRVIKLHRRGSRITGSEVLVKGLDNGCHGMDFIHGRLCLVDSYDQKVLRFATGESAYETLTPLPVPEIGRFSQTDPRYLHVNSIMAVGEHILLLLHNAGEQHGNRTSEIAVYDRAWQPVMRFPVRGVGCHSLALREDGMLLTCASMQGDLIDSGRRLTLKISPYMTRGIALGRDSVVVGASPLVERAGRTRATGKVTFMDAQYNVQTVLDVPGAGMEIRRIDGEDGSLSEYLERVPWGSDLSFEAEALRRMESVRR